MARWDALPDVIQDAICSYAPHMHQWNLCLQDDTVGHPGHPRYTVSFIRTEGFYRPVDGCLYCTLPVDRIPLLPPDQNLWSGGCHWKFWFEFGLRLYGASLVHAHGREGSGWAHVGSLSTVMHRKYAGWHGVCKSCTQYVFSNCVVYPNTLLRAGDDTDDGGPHVRLVVRDTGDTSITADLAINENFDSQWEVCTHASPPFIVPLFFSFQHGTN